MLFWYILFGIIDLTNEKFQFQLICQFSFIECNLFLNERENLHIIEMYKRQCHNYLFKPSLIHVSKTESLYYFWVLYSRSNKKMFDQAEKAHKGQTLQLICSVKKKKNYKNVTRADVIKFLAVNFVISQSVCPWKAFPA